MAVLLGFLALHTRVALFSAIGLLFVALIVKFIRKREHVIAISLLGIPLWQLVHDSILQPALGQHTWLSILVQWPLIFLFLVVVASRDIKERRHIPASMKIYLAWVGLYSCVTVIGNQQPLTQTLSGFLIDAGYILVFLMTFSVADLVRHDFILRIVRYSVYLGTFIAAFGIFQSMFAGEHLIEALGVPIQDMGGAVRIVSGHVVYRAVSVLGSPLSLGSYLVFSFANALNPRVRVRYRPLVLAVILVAEFLTYTRGAWVAIAIVILMNAGSFKRKYRGFYYWVVVSLGFGLFVWGIVPVSFHTGSASIHVGQLSEDIAKLSGNPAGFGVGAFGLAAQRHATSTSVFVPESGFLEVGLEMGWIGLALYAWLVIGIVKRLMTSGDAERVVGISVIAITVMSFVLESWGDMSTAYLVWGIAGLLIGRSRNDEHSHFNVRVP